MTINGVTICNYKSIKKIDIETKRINIFIGEHNSGKSNILEALTWFSINALEPNKFSDLFRFRMATDFFYDFDLTHPIEIKTSTLSLILRYAKNKNGALMNNLEGLIYPSDSKIDFDVINNFQNLTNRSNLISFTLSFDGKLDYINGSLDSSSFRTYIFKKIKSFESNFRPFLNPPFGENIPSLLVSNRYYKDLIGSLFKEKGFRLMLKPNENDINMAKDINDELYSYPYTSISETIQRIVFYTLAIESNKEACLIFDEPESNTFPMYTKQLAEQIALDKNGNQYFIATHNPYLLNSLVSKAPSEEIALYVTKMEHYETKVYRVKDTELSTLLDKGIDVYFNLNKLVNHND